jgi:hypothetical protein
MAATCMTLKSCRKAGCIMWQSVEVTTVDPPNPLSLRALRPTGSGQAQARQFTPPLNPLHAPAQPRFREITTLPDEAQRDSIIDHRKSQNNTNEIDKMVIRRIGCT